MTAPMRPTFARVVITSVSEDGESILALDELGRSFEIDGRIRPKGSALPKVDETWYIDKTVGYWRLDFQFGAAMPPVVTTASSDAILTALHTAGVVDNQSAPAPPADVVTPVTPRTKNQGAWQGPGYAYREGEYVRNSGARWLSLDAHTSGSTFVGDVAHWLCVGATLHGPFPANGVTARNNDANAMMDLTIPAMPFRYRAIPHGLVEIHGDQGTAPLANVMLGFNGGTVIGIAAGEETNTSGGGSPAIWHRVPIVPWIANDFGTGPDSASGIIPAGQSQYIGVYLGRQYGNGFVSNSTFFANLAVYVQPILP